VIEVTLSQAVVIAVCQAISCSIQDIKFCRKDRLCGLVVRVSGYRYRGPGFDPGATRFSE